jgi:hypothetical protein
LLCGTLARQHAAGYFFVEGVSAGDVQQGGEGNPGVAVAAFEK